MVWIVQLGFNWMLLVILICICLYGVIGQPTHGIHFDNSHCFEFFNSTRTWKEAGTVCSDKGGILLTHTDTSVISNIVLSFTKSTTPVWIGARNVWNWTWEDGQAVNFTNWGPGEPSFDGDHIILWTKNRSQNTIPQFTWKVLSGDTILSDGIISKYICQFDEVIYCHHRICSYKDLNRCLTWHGSCYYIGGILGANYGLNMDKFISHTWDKARLQCQNINATLVKLPDRETEEKLEDFIRTNYSDFAGDFWIGATADKKKDSWIWLSGEPVVHMKQNASQGGVNNCLLWTHGGGLQPEQCNSSHTFVCQYCGFGNASLNRGKVDKSKPSTPMEDTGQASKHLLWIVISIPATLAVVIIVGIILCSRKEGIEPQEVELETDKNIYETTVNPMYGLRPDDPRRMGRSLLSYKGERPFHVNSTVREKRLIFYSEETGISRTETPTAPKHNYSERQIPASFCLGEVQSNGCADINGVHHGSPAPHPSYRNDTNLAPTLGSLNKVFREPESPTHDDRLHRFPDTTLRELDGSPEDLCSKDQDKGLDFDLDRMQDELAQLYKEIKFSAHKREIRDDDYIHSIPDPDYPLSDDDLF